MFYRFEYACASERVFECWFGLLFWWSQAFECHHPFCVRNGNGGNFSEIANISGKCWQFYLRPVFHTYSPFVNKILFVFASILSLSPTRAVHFILAVQFILRNKTNDSGTSFWWRIFALLTVAASAKQISKDFAKSMIISVADRRKKRVTVPFIAMIFSQPPILFFHSAFRTAAGCSISYVLIFINSVAIANDCFRRNKNWYCNR